MWGARDDTNGSCGVVIAGPGAEGNGRSIWLAAVGEQVVP